MSVRLHHIHSQQMALPFLHLNITKSLNINTNHLKNSKDNFLDPEVSQTEQNCEAQTGSIFPTLV
jgi:hypothetical protein